MILKHLLSAVLALASSAYVAQEIPVRTFVTYTGAYDPTLSYSINDMVTLGGSTYISVASNNVGNAVTNTSFWFLIGFSSSSPTIYAAALPGADAGAQIEAADQQLGTAAGQIIYAGTPGALATTPVTLSANHSLVLATPISWQTSITLPTNSGGQSVSCPAMQTLGHTTPTDWISGFYNSDVTLKNCAMQGVIQSGYSTDIALHLYAGTRIHVTDNLIYDAQLLATDTAGANYAAATPANSTSWIDVTGNHGYTRYLDAPIFVFTGYTMDGIISHNIADGFNFGVYWWGGDSCVSNCTAGGNGAAANPRKTGYLTISANSFVAGQACIWGSMGEFLTISGNTCQSEGGGDVGLDLEGTQDSTVTDNIVQGYNNGGLTTFWLSTRNVWTGNVVTEGTPNPVHLYNATQTATGLSETFDNNTFTCAAACAISLDATEYVTFRNNLMTNVELLGGFNQSQVLIDGNTMMYTVAIPYAISFPSISYASTSAQAVVRRNTIYSSAAQASGASAIYIAGTDFNAPQQTLITDNILGGSSPFPVDIACYANSTNSANQANFCTIRNNTLAANNIVTGAAASTRVVVNATNNVPRFTAVAPTQTVVATFTTTAAAYDAVAVPGMTASGHCAAPGPLNNAAAAASPIAYVSAVGLNQVSVVHPSTAGMVYSVLCTPF